MKGIHTSAMFTIFWTLLISCNIIRLRSQTLQYGELVMSLNTKYCQKKKLKFLKFITFLQDREDDTTLYVVYFAYFTLITAEFFFTLFSDVPAKRSTGPLQHYESCDERQPLLSQYISAAKKEKVNYWNAEIIFLSGKIYIRPPVIKHECSNQFVEKEIPEARVPAWNRMAFIWVFWYVNSVVNTLCFGESINCY